MQLRALEPLDVDTLCRWENDPAVWGLGGTLAPYSRRQLWDYVNNYDADIYSARQLRLMIDTDTPGGPGGEPRPVTVGAVDLYDFDPANSRCGVGILIYTPWRRQGLGRQALAMLAHYCRSRLSLHQLWAIASTANVASRRLFGSAGYAETATLRSWLCSAGRYTDAVMMQLML